ncbi:MAG: NAD-dependent protein deacylase [Candidatus Heimdallarchaeota archaeon]|nr:NAD-dependent protein deacylase [Candidatus Heimdallarchaeota archaeon]
MSSKIEDAVNITKKAFQNKSLSSYILSGAGLSKGSNIPTFRGDDGLWEKYNFEEVATKRAWQKNPEKLWSFYVEGINLILKAQPNPAHYAITDLEKSGYCEYIITQNADGLHQKAGSKNVLEIHGNITRVRCAKCTKIREFIELPPIIPPRCECGGMYRPDVVLFNETLPQKLINKAFQVAKKAKLVIIVGTSAEVMPAAYLPILSKQNKAQILVFNTEQTEHNSIADIFIQGKCEETLPEFVKKLLEV